jgi:hypothetical protein
MIEGGKEIPVRVKELMSGPPITIVPIVTETDFLRAFVAHAANVP